MFWGDRAARIVDPFGNDWFIATRRALVPRPEIERRLAELVRARNHSP